MKSWRDLLPIHPGAELFPLMAPDELRALAADIKTNGLHIPITLWKEQKHIRPKLLDGRNRLDGMEAAGIEIKVEPCGTDGDPDVQLAYRRSKAHMWMPIEATVVRGDRGVDPYATVISANITRRHLNVEQRQHLLITLIARAPEKSDRQIGKEIGVDHKTIARARTKGEDVGRIPHVDTHTDSKGRQQPAKRNLVRPQLYREAKLGADVMAKIRGTSLDSAAELDELVVLNRGAPQGGLTKPVAQLVAAAAAGQKVSAVEYTKSGAAFRREDVGANSAGEVERLRTDNDQLRTDKRRLEIKWLRNDVPLCAGFSGRGTRQEDETKSTHDDWVEDHMRRFRKPDGHCLHCRQPANRTHPVGPLIVKIAEPDSGDELFTHEFCNWECLAHWMATQAGGVFVVDRN